MATKIGGQRILRRPKDQLEEYTPLTAGETAAQIFEDFDRGRDLRHIVKARSVTPQEVMALYEEWCEPDLEKRHHDLVEKKTAHRQRNSGKKNALEQSSDQRALDREIESAQTKNKAMRMRLNEEDNDDRGRLGERATTTLGGDAAFDDEGEDDVHADVPPDGE